MEIDVSGLTFRDATKEEKRKIFRLMNLRSFIWVACAIILVIGVLLIPIQKKWLTIFGLSLSAVVLIYTVLTEMPAWQCKVCTGIVTNKREVSASEETGLYYNAVTFRSESGEVMETMPVFDNRTLDLLHEGSRATIVCYNKRHPVLFADEQINKK
ncbi:MAG: hypothetical protein J5752_10385 [Clostridiales bacterium]|nr:hypothetical protein [Clostridiales bacterium]